ncbi:hypothetical protein ACFQ1B_34270 [Streptomyces mexicanus]
MTHRAFRTSRVLTTGLAVAAAVAATVLPAAPAAAAEPTVYLDCSRPTDGDGSRDHPYNTLASVNARIFRPGETLALASGTTCTGTLAPQGSGTASAPVAITPYGTGAAPVIDAAGAENALHLTDQDHWRIGAIKLTDPASTTGRRQGLLIESTDGRTHTGFDIDGLIVDRVAGRRTRPPTRRRSPCPPASAPAPPAPARSSPTSTCTAPGSATAAAEASRCASALSTPGWAATSTSTTTPSARSAGTASSSPTPSRR